MSALLRALHPAPDELAGVWRANQLARPQQALLASGHAALDAELPGQGWPLGQLTEILQAHCGQHEWRLLLPALSAATERGVIVLVGAPHVPNLPVLTGLGVTPRRVLRIDAHSPAERLWVAEQALRCRELGALLVWLPQARSEQLRRLQLRSNAAPALVFALRPLQARHESSPAPLRIIVQAAPSADSTQLSVQILKRRGPLLAQPLALDAPLPVLAALKPVHSRTPEPSHAVDCPAHPRIRELAAV